MDEEIKEENLDENPTYSLIGEEITYYNKTFDVNTYETEDLLGILNLTGQAPINNEKIEK